MYNLFIVVKIIGIIFAILWFAIFGTINAKIIDYLFLQNIDDEKHVTNLQTFSWVVILTICVSILCFFGRNIIERIPFVLENVQAFEFKRLKEIKSGSILLFFSILFSSAYHNIIQRIKELKL